jgi:hypothetical protein
MQEVVLFEKQETHDLSLTRVEEILDGSFGFFYDLIKNYSKKPAHEKKFTKIIELRHLWGFNGCFVTIAIKNEDITIEIITEIQHGTHFELNKNRISLLRDDD